MYTIRIEAWNENGSSHNFHSELLHGYTYEQVKEIASEVWKGYYVGKKKMMNIYGKDGLIKSHKNFENETS